MLEQPCIVTRWHDVRVGRLVSFLENIKTNGRSFAAATLGINAKLKGFLLRADGLTEERSCLLQKVVEYDHEGTGKPEWQKVQDEGEAEDQGEADDEDEDEDKDEDAPEKATVTWKSVNARKLLQEVGRCFSEIQVRCFIERIFMFMGLACMWLGNVPSSDGGWMMDVQALIGIKFSKDTLLDIISEDGSGPLKTLDICQAAFLVGRLGLPMVGDDIHKECYELDARFVEPRDEATKKRAAKLEAHHFYRNICNKEGYTEHNEVCLAMLVYGGCLAVADDAVGVFV